MEIKNDEDGSVRQIYSGKLYVKEGDKKWYVTHIKQGDSTFINGPINTNTIIDNAINESDKNKIYNIVIDSNYIKVILEERYFDFANGNDDIIVEKKEVFKVKR